MAYEQQHNMCYTVVCRVFTLAVIALAVCPVVQGEDFFCVNNQVIHIRNITQGRIITREQGTTHYRNNLHCIWLIEAPEASDADMALNINVKQSELEWAPEGALCISYDYVTVYDGNTANSQTRIGTWCGARNPRSLTSTGRSLYIEFYANDRNQSPHTGVELQFTVFERKQTEGGCPPGWLDDPDLPGGGLVCYVLRTHSETWTKAQMYCGYDQANLVSLTDGKEEVYISKLISNALSPSERVWLSLNDIEVDGQYRWLNGDNLTFMRWKNPNHKSDSYYNCVTMDGEGNWQEDFCNENDINSLVKHKFICEKNKVGRTVVYQIPAERHTKGGENNSHQNTLITVVIVVGCIILAIIIAVVLLCCFKQFRSSNKPSASNGAAKYEMAERQPSGSRQCTSSVSNSAQETRQTQATAPPTQEQQPHTVVVVVQQHGQPSEPPPPYEEAAS